MISTVQPPTKNNVLRNSVQLGNRRKLNQSQGDNYQIRKEALPFGGVDQGESPMNIVLGSTLDHLVLPAPAKEEAEVSSSIMSGFNTQR